MKSLLSVGLVVMMLGALPVQAQGLDTLLPTLTFPEDGVSGSSKGCEPAGGAVCTPQK